MPVGMQVINDSGTILFSDTNPNYQYKSKGSAPTGADGLLSVTTAGTQPLIAFRCPFNVLMKKTLHVGSNFTFTFQGVAGAVVDYWIFDVPGTVPSGTMGLQVRNAAGQLMFDAGERLAVIVDNVYFTTTLQTITLPAGKTFAMLPLSSGRGKEGRSTGPNQAGFHNWERRFIEPYMRCTGSSFTYEAIDDGWFALGTEEVPMPAGMAALRNPDVRILFVDVTGF